MIDIHVFQDSLGHYATSTCIRIDKLNIKQKQILFINISNHLISYDTNLITHLPDNWKVLKKYFSKQKNVKNIFFHNYNYTSQFILKILKNNNNLIISNWIFWSAEFYNLPEISSNYYIGKSKKYYPHNNILKRLKFHLFHLKEKLLGRPFYSHYSFIKSYSEIDYLITFLNSDYQNIINYSNANLKFKIFAYLSFEQFLDQSFVKKSTSGKNKYINILLNHNGDPMLNHFDALDKLNAFKESDLNIILPLAYGNSKYIKDIKEYFRNSYNPNKIEIWDKFIPPIEYSSKLASIDIAIFNFSVQKGFGNLLPLLWMGAKIFLREECPIYIDFKNLGFYIFSVQNDLCESSLLKKLTEEEKNRNRKLLYEYFSNTSIDKYYIDCFINV